MTAIWMLIITLDSGVSYPPSCKAATCIKRETTIEFPTVDRYECQFAADELHRTAYLPKGIELKAYCKERP